MTVSEIHEALGAFTIKLKPNVPRDVLDQIEYFGHVAVIPGRIDARTYGDSTLTSARYVGVLRKKKISDSDAKSDTAGTAVELSGVGMAFWLGDENDKGSVIENEVVFNSVNFTTAVSGLLPPAVTLGTVGGVSGTYSGIHQWQTPRKAIQYVCDTMSQPPDPFNLISTDNSSFESTGGTSGWVAASNCSIIPAVAWRSAGTYASGTGNVVPGLPSGWQMNDIFIMSVEFDGTDNPTITASGWTQIGTTQRTTTATGTRTGQAVFWRRATSSETAPTILDTGDHTSAIIHAFTGCKLSGSPVNTSNSTWYGTETTSMFFPTITTTVDNCIIVALATHGVDTASAQFSGWNGFTDMGTVTERSDDSTTQGSGGGIGVATATKSPAGSTGGSPQVTFATATSQTAILVALEPEASTASSLYSYLGTKSMQVTPTTIGAMTAKTNGTANAATVVEGTTYNCYFWVLPTGVSCYARVGVDYRTSGGTLVSSASTDTFLALPQNAWTQVSRSITVPTGGSITKADFVVNLSSNASGDKFYVDNVQLAATTVAVPASFRVNGNGTIDAGPESTLYVTNPKSILVRQGSLQGEDLNVKAIPGTIGLDQDMEDFATRVVVLGQSDNLQFTVGESDIGSVSPGTNVYKDIHGNPLKLTRMVSESQTTDTNADTRAELALRQTITPHRDISLDTKDYDIYGSFDVGDYVYVYDPDGGLVDTANEVYVRGSRLNPIKLQVTEAEWPVTAEYSVAYRAADGTWYDLTDYLAPEDSRGVKVVIGDFQRTLDSTLQNVTSRLGSNAAPDNSTPAAVDWTVSSFQTVAYLDKNGNARAQQQLVWGVPLNEDGSAVTDGAYYEIQYKLDTGHLYSQTWGAVSTLPWGQLNTWAQPVQASVVNWETRQVQWGTNSMVINDLATGTAYDFRIRAIDNSNNLGEWSVVEIVTTAEDDIPPSQPNAPTVASSLIAIQVTHDLGLSSGGSFNLERDIAYLEIHGEYEPGFIPGDSTKLGNLIATSNMLDAQTPAVGTFPVSDTTEIFVKVVAVDKSGNRSQASVAQSATATLIDDAHISDLTVSKITAGTITSDWLLAGTIKTGVDGQRVEINSSGIQAFNADGDLTTNISSDPTIDRDFISWRSQTGDTLASVNSLGAASFQDVAVADTLTVQGTDILTELLKRPKGVVAFGVWNDAAHDVSMPVAGAEWGFMELSFIAETDRMYKITQFGECDTSNVDAQLFWNLRYTTDGTRPTISSFQLTNQVFFSGSFAGSNTTNFFSVVASFPPGKVRLLWLISGNGVIQNIYSTAGPSQFTVEDIGDVALFDNIAVLNDGQGTGTETDEDITGLVTTYESTWTRSYNSDGSLRTEIQTDNGAGVNDLCYQGYYSGTHGNQRSLIGFNDAAIRSDLAGSTLKKIEVYLYAMHWYHDYGYASIGTHGYTAAPGTWSGGSVNEQRYTSSSWGVSTGRWVEMDLTWASEFQAGTSTGLALGPGPTTGSEYYGYFAGQDYSTRPKIRITYTK